MYDERRKLCMYLSLTYLLALMVSPDCEHHAVTVKQVLNYWNSAWDKYKACRTCAEHTGGGDGDADREDESGSRKRKRGFSEKVLDVFENLRIYLLIDEV